MKKIVALLLAVLLLFSVTACGGGSKTEAPSGTTGENGTSGTEEAKGDIVIGCNFYSRKNGGGRSKMGS